MYAEFDDYRNRFDTVTDETQFAQLAERAAEIIDIMTHNRAATATGYKQARVQTCACALVELLATEGDGLGRGVSSFSNDGYSESYAFTTQAEVDENRRQCVMRCLSGTGLVSAL